jgi:hypothetical protein
MEGVYALFDMVPCGYRYWFRLTVAKCLYSELLKQAHTRSALLFYPQSSEEKV